MNISPKILIIVVVVLLIFIIREINKPPVPIQPPRGAKSASAARSSDAPNGSGSTSIAEVLTPEPGRETIMAKRYNTVRLGTITWLGDDLDLDVGENYVCKKRAIKENGKYVFDENINFRYSKLRPPRRYYSREAAEKACKSIGWRLPTLQDFQTLLINVAPPVDSTAKQGFDPQRAYGALVSRGDLGFNVNLTGYFDLTDAEVYTRHPELETRLYEFGEEANYWIQDYHSENGKPLYYKFSKADVTVVRYYLGDYDDGEQRNRAYACRCVRDE